MALIIPPGFAQAAYRLRLDGDTEDMVTTCGHELDTASGANVDDIADDLMGAFGTTIMTELPNVYSLVAVDVYVGQDGPPLVVTSTAAPIDGGAGAVSAVPQNSALLLRKRTDLGGRRGRGRMYIPGVREDQVNNAGTLNGSFVDLMQGLADDWYEKLTALIGGRLYPPVVLHRSEGAGVEPAPTPITRFTLEERIATQRRRLRP